MHNGLAESTLLTGAHAIQCFKLEWATALELGHPDPPTDHAYGAHAVNFLGPFLRLDAVEGVTPASPQITRLGIGGEFGNIRRAAPSSWNSKDLNARESM